MMEADKDQLITEDADAAYRKCPGVNNVAYVVSGGAGEALQWEYFYIGENVATWRVWSCSTSSGHCTAILSSW